MTQLIYISHSLIVPENVEFIQKLIDARPLDRKIVVFDNEANYLKSNDYNSMLMRNNVVNVLWFVNEEDCHDDKMSERIALHQKSEQWNKLCVSNFVIFDKENTPLRKMFPNNFIEVNGPMTVKDVNSAEWIFSQFGTDRPLQQNTWFIADTHFFHANIIRYCNRPWNSGKDESGNIIVTDKDVFHMNEDLIANWNSVVGKNDVVWHLGGVCFGKKDNIKRVVPRLNGRINLVMGNHDRESVKFYYDAGFNLVYNHPVLLNSYIILSHVPMSFLNRNTPFFNIAGHVHDSSAYPTWSPTQCIVSVERHNYTPVSWTLIEQKYQEQQRKI